MKKSNPEYLAKVSQLSEEEKERLLSRMGGKLPKRIDKNKLSVEDALAMQLELEDEQLEEWRNRLMQMRAKDAAKAAKKDKEAAAPKAEAKPAAGKAPKAAPVETKPAEKPAKPAAAKPAKAAASKAKPAKKA